MIYVAFHCERYGISNANFSGFWPASWAAGAVGPGPIRSPRTWAELSDLRELLIEHVRDRMRAERLPLVDNSDIKVTILNIMELD